MAVSQIHYSSVAHSVDLCSNQTKDRNVQVLRSLHPILSHKFLLIYIKTVSLCNNVRGGSGGGDASAPRVFRASPLGEFSFLSIRHKWIIPLGEAEHQSRRTEMSTFVCVVGGRGGGGRRSEGLERETRNDRSFLVVTIPFV